MEQVHVIAAITAVTIGAIQAVRRKQGVSHRWLGWFWVGAMAIVALSSFFLQSMTGGFSFLHGLSVYVLVMLIMGVLRARQGRFAEHGLFMINTWGGLATAGWLAASRHGLDVPVAVHAVVIGVFWATLTFAIMPLHRQIRLARRRTHSRDARPAIARGSGGGILGG